MSDTEPLDERTARECARLICQYCAGNWEWYSTQAKKSRGMYYHGLNDGRRIRGTVRRCDAETIWERLAEQGIKP